MKTKKYLDSLNIVLNFIDEDHQNSFEELINSEFDSQPEKLGQWDEISAIENLLSKRIAQIEFSEANPVLTQHIFYHAIVVQHELLQRGQYYNPLDILGQLDKLYEAQ